jgi:hypothetical protein
MTSHVGAVRQALPLLRFTLLGHHSLKPGDFAEISVSKVLLSVQSAGLLNA